MGEGVPNLDGGGYLPFTGYAAGGMPLVFMQEDCLVVSKFMLKVSIHTADEVKAVFVVIRYIP